jgi:DNA-binding CsgD family transcriptional regulator
MWPVDRPPQWVGRGSELARLRVGVEALRRGEGAVAWVEGEPGIGKSSLVARVLAEASGLGWDVGWAIADQLTERLPLRAMQDCLRVRPGSPDPRRAHAAGLLRGQRVGLFADGDASVGGVEVLVALADELCAAAPTVLVLDDVQWADDASLLVWHQLSASIDQLRLLLIATCRPSPGRAEVQQMRAAAARRGVVVTLGPLAKVEVATLVTGMLGSPPGAALRQLTAQAAGNPLYLRELVDALLREEALEIGPAAAEIKASTQERLPASLAAVLNDRLSTVSAQTAQMLRTAALLRGNFTVTDLAVLLRRPASELAAALQEAVTAGILAGSGSELTFRHPLIRQALYESVPAALRTALHAEAAQELATTGADALSVAQQLLAARLPSGGWARAWLISAAPALSNRAPQLAADLLRRELDETLSSDEAWDGLMASLGRALLAAGSYDEAASRASQALTVMTDPVRRAETFWVLARAQVSAGENHEAITTLRQALARTDLPRTWQARMLALLAMLERASTGDLDAADATARRSLSVAGEAGDAFATAHALTDLWLSHGVRRDHAAALDCIDQALEQSGETRQAMLVLAAILPRRGGEMTLVHQWLPDLVRLAMAAGDRRVAQAAAKACQAEAAAETRPARAAAASLWCDGLLESDPVPLREVVAHYRTAGPAAHLPGALEDLAVVLAKRGQEDEARAAFNEAVTLYDGLQAHWDIRRAEGRLRSYGIRRTVRGRRRQHADRGWEALTPTELKIAAMVAGGESTSDIAQGMFMSRRTVQTHISHILAKLGAKGRVDIVREALGQGIFR